MPLNYMGTFTKKQKLKQKLKKIISRGLMIPVKILILKISMLLRAYLVTILKALIKHINPTLFLILSHNCRVKSNFF